MLQSDQATRNANTPQNRHCWTFFIRMDSEQEEREFIERVVVHLHHTFNPSVAVLTEPPFLVRRMGWGIFVVRAEVHFKERWRHPPIWCRWLLDFDGMGDMMEAELHFADQHSGSGGVQPSPGVGPAGRPTASRGEAAEGGEGPSLSSVGGATGGPLPSGLTAAPGVSTRVTPAALARRSTSAGGGLLPTSGAVN
ncbi:hypothetical protein VaNZ11_002734, partial [Volvox africanus]